MHKFIQHMLLTHVLSIQDAAGSHYVARFRETKWQMFVRAIILIENEDVLGLVVGSWARTWHKSSAVTHHFQAP